jgi:hypothetical protein
MDWLIEPSIFNIFSHSNAQKPEAVEWENTVDAKIKAREFLPLSLDLKIEDCWIFMVYFELLLLSLNQEVPSSQ